MDKELETFEADLLASIDEMKKGRLPARRRSSFLRLQKFVQRSEWLNLSLQSCLV